VLCARRFRALACVVLCGLGFECSRSASGLRSRCVVLQRFSCLRYWGARLRVLLLPRNVIRQSRCDQCWHGGDPRTLRVLGSLPCRPPSWEPTYPPLRGRPDAPHPRQRGAPRGHRELRPRAAHHHPPELAGTPPPPPANPTAAITPHHCKHRRPDTQTAGQPPSPTTHKPPRPATPAPTPHTKPPPEATPQLRHHQPHPNPPTTRL